MGLKNRVSFNIQLFDNSVHHAWVRPETLIGQFIQEILVEFGIEYPYLNQHDTKQYYLRPQHQQQPLPEDQSAFHVRHFENLVLEEQPLKPPAESTVLDSPFYLKCRSHVFRMGWAPALIGRPSDDGKQHRLTVNLESFSLAVSRNHAEFVLVDRQLCIRRLSNNPTYLNGVLLPFDEINPTLSKVIPIADQDTILLERSGIVLTCLMPTFSKKGG